MLEPASVLVTGANRGIGLELVRQVAQLSQRPGHVFACCRTPDQAEDLQEMARSLDNVTVVKLDLKDHKSITECANTVQSILGDRGLNLLINNAGVATKSDLNHVTADDMTSAFNVNVVGTLMVTKTFLPLLRKATSGSGAGMSCNKAAIINMSSGCGSITENDKGGGYAYRTSKAALNMITKNLSLDLLQDGILVTAVHPGWVQTNMGGAKAPTDTPTCVQSLISLFATFQGQEHSGKFYEYSGREIPW